MFPNTEHIESLVVLTPKNKDGRFAAKTKKPQVKVQRELNPYEKALKELQASKRKKRK